MLKFESDKIKEPFLTVLNLGQSVNYKCSGLDHEYVKKLGYVPELHSDCSYSAKGLYGINLSSYGNWGTVYPSSMDENSKKIFIDMLEDSIIELCSCMIYLNRVPYDYDGENWKTYNGTDWVTCDTPDIFN